MNIRHMLLTTLTVLSMQEYCYSSDNNNTITRRPSFDGQRDSNLFVGFAGWNCETLMVFTLNNLGNTHNHYGQDREIRPGSDEKSVQKWNDFGKNIQNHEIADKFLKAMTFAKIQIQEDTNNHVLEIIRTHQYKQIEEKKDLFKKTLADVTAKYNNYKKEEIESSKTLTDLFKELQETTESYNQKFFNNAISLDDLTIKKVKEINDKNIRATIAHNNITK